MKEQENKPLQEDAALVALERVERMYKILHGEMEAWRNEAKSVRSWKPIDTAPKNDGEHCLLFGSDEHCTNTVFIGCWCDYADHWVAFGNNDRIVPTHWMPLPPDPIKS